ncbi:GFA family protein [Chromobacterium sp. CV08]|uniref:GFA family protein n=1 Tax=Chromobacterium sp. CV08 TaxID=3133274 RepID=UPI003DA9CF49
MQIHGACHCGNISFDLDWPPETAVIPARRCDCGFCRKHGGIWTASPAAGLTVALRDPQRVSHYRFGTGTADFHICSGCGVAPLVTSEIDGRLYAVVSVNAFETPGLPLGEAADVSFDGESEAERLARRARNWIPDVRFA